MQQYSSMNTSINKNKLPASTKNIPWSNYAGQNVLDFGGGKYNNLKDFVKTTYDVNLFVYDLFNRTEIENVQAMKCNPSVIVCNNVLNVISEGDSHGIFFNL